MATEEQIEIFEVIKIHTSALEIERDAASGFARELLELRLEAARSLLEWLSTIPQLDLWFCQAAEKTKLSNVAVERDQDPQSTFARLQQFALR